MTFDSISLESFSSSPKCHDEGKQEFSDYKPVQLHQCIKCHKAIEKTEPFSYYENNPYHNACFTCNRCGLSLVDKPCTRLGSAIVSSSFASPDNLFLFCTIHRVLLRARDRIL